MNPYTFLVGAARSGTTLLQRMVDAHPQIAITPESAWISRYKSEGLAPEDPVTRAVIDRLADDPCFQLMGISREELDALVASAPGLTYVPFVRAIFDLYGRKQAKALVGDKTPSYVRAIRKLHRLFPQTRFAHIIRDGREVCLSVLHWDKGPRVVGRFATWSDDPVSTCALWWEWSVRRGREAGDTLASRLYHELRYDDLVNYPEETCAALCRFLDLPYDSAMVRFHEGRIQFEPGLDAKDAWLPVTAGLRDWSRQMSAEDVERFEATAGDLLDELGYPRCVPHPSASAQRWARELRERFSEDAVGKGSPLPRRW